MFKGIFEFSMTEESLNSSQYAKNGYEAGART